MTPESGGTIPAGHVHSAVAARLLSVRCPTKSPRVVRSGVGNEALRPRDWPAQPVEAAELGCPAHGLPCAAGLFTLCAGHDDPLPVELRMCVDGEHTFAVVSPASLRAVADVASRIDGCQFYDPSLSYYYAPFILRRNSWALIAGDHD